MRMLANDAVIDFLTEIISDLIEDYSEIQK